MGRRQLRVRGRLGLVVLALLVLLIVAVPVMADPAEPEPPAPASSFVAPMQASEYPVPDPPSLTSVRQAEEEREAELEQQPFVAEREASRHAYDDATPAEAEELLRSTFGETFTRLNDEPARFLSDAKLDKNLGNGSALVTSEGKTEILEADEPVEAEDDEGETGKVDLSLEPTREGFEAENPLVEVAIGKTAEEGVELGEEGLTVTQVGAEESKARLLGDKNVFFGEVEAGSDTDLMVSPTSRGVELFDLLRSVDSPETLRFHLGLPAGDTLSMVGGGAAVEVLDAEGSVVGLVPGASAEDAQGRHVPVEMHLEGDTIVLQTHHREEDLAYPIEVDPSVNEVGMNWEEWYAGHNLGGLGCWNPVANVGWANHFTRGQVSGGIWNGLSGLFVSTENNVMHPGGWGEWILNSPNLGVFLSSVTINPFLINRQECGGYLEPYDFAGLFDVQNQHYVEEKSNEAYWNHFVNLTSWGHQIVFGLKTDIEVEDPCWRDLMAGGVSFRMGDWGAPDMVSATSPVSSGWIKGNTEFPITVNATDGGLGVKEFAFAPDEANPGNPVPKNVGCVGTYESPCPLEVHESFTFHASEFPPGEDNLHINVDDAAAKPAPTSVPLTIKVDSSPPQVHIEGQLATSIKEAGPGELQGEGGPELSQPVYNLKVEATDGTEGTTRPGLKQSGVEKVAVEITGEKGELQKSWVIPNKSCPQGSCAETFTQPIPMVGLAGGKHHLVVTTWDYAGNVPVPIEREFEYFPATGLTEEDITQRFLLPDGKEHGEGSYQGPELAVNVMNGNVVYHQRDVEVEGPDADLEVELFYNSQLPTEQSSEFGKGWTLSQTPSLKPSPGNMATALTSESALAGNVALPQEVGKEQFSEKLGAVITKEAGGGYSVSEEGGAEAPATVYDSSGKAIEEQTSPTAAVEYGYEGGHLDEIAVDDPGTTTVPPSPVKKAPSVVPNYVTSLGSAGTGAGQLSRPADVALDPKGDEWVVDSGNNRIEEFSPGGDFIRSLGTAGTGNGQFTSPRALAFDATGDLWVADSGDNRLEEFSAVGGFLRSVGTKGTGNGQFSEPEGVAVTSSGHVLVSDTGNHRIQELTATGEFIKVIAPSVLGEFQPKGIDVAPDGKIWFADWAKNRLVQLGPAGEALRYAGSKGTGEKQFEHPGAVAVGALGEVFAVDTGNGRVEEITKEGTYVTQFGSTGTGAGQFTFNAPVGIATDNEGSLFVTDPGGNRVEHWQIPHFGYKPVYASSFGGTGTGQGQFRHPGDLAVDRQGDVWVPDVENNRLQEFDPSGAFKRQLGSVGTGNGQFSSPKGIAFTDEGEFWVADSGNSRLEEFAENGTFIRSVGKAGSGNGQFQRPEALAVAPNGHIWVADTYNYRIEELDENGNFIRVVNPAGLGQIEPTGIAFGPGGNAWIADWANNRVVEINPAGELVRQFGTAGSGNGQFNHPDTVAIDPRGIVYVVDQTNGRVQVFNQEGVYLGQFGSAGSGSGQFKFGYPTGIAADARGNLWVADSENNRIQKWQTGSWVPAEEEAAPPTGDDPSVDVTTSAGLVTHVAGGAAGSHRYGHQGQLLISDEGPEGNTKYEYEAERLKKVTLPNGTTASITYDGYGRALTVTVDPVGEAEPKTTTFTYVQEIAKGVAENHKVALGSREIIVEPQSAARTFYAIDSAGDVVKSWNVEVAPVIFSEGGTLTQASKEKAIDVNDTQELTINAFAPEGVRKIQFIVNGTTIVDEKTCTGTATQCEHETLQWIVEPGDLPSGTMWIEVVLTSRVEEHGEPRRSSTRWWVTVPYVPPPEPGVPQPPKYKQVKEFREERGLDLDLNPVADELALHARVWETIDAWWAPDTPAGGVAQATWERWGVPLRYVDEQELEYRLAYIAQDVPLIQEWAKAHAWGQYGGYWVDERAGGLIRVGFTEHQAELVAQMKAELGSALAATERITTFTTPPTSTVAQVEASASSIHAYAASHLALQENMATAEFVPATNKVRVEALNVPSAETEVAAAIGSLSHVEFLRAPERPQLLAGRYRSSGPIKAGDFVADLEPPNFACTAGFGADEQRPPGEATKKYLLTAGHCFPVGHHPKRADDRKDTSNEWHEIGVVAANAFPENRSAGERDVEAIELRSEGLAPTEIYPHKLIGPASGPDGWEAGQELCFTGTTDGLQCGHSAGVTTYVPGSQGKFTFSGSPLLGEETWIIRLDHVTLNHGDSGSPVWNVGTGKSVGILSSGAPLGVPDGSAYITPLKPIPGTSQQGALKTLTDDLNRRAPLTVNPYGE
jgi:sugar lactone lactonase YvrE